MKKLAIFTSTFLFGLWSLQASAETPLAPASPAVTTESRPTMLTQAQSQNVVNLNTATAAELQNKLVNIGEKKAQAIVEYREKYGKFVSIEQLTEVSGIGKATLDKNRDRIVLE